MKLSSKEQKVFNEINENVAKILIATMRELDIPNYIESTWEFDGYKYELKFTRQKL